jgi:hypothetical protein
MFGSPGFIGAVIGGIRMLSLAARAGATHIVQKNSKKIVIFYSSIGNGHIAAAQATRGEE